MQHGAKTSHMPRLQFTDQGEASGSHGVGVALRLSSPRPPCPRPRLRAPDARGPHISPRRDGPSRRSDVGAPATAATPHTPHARFHQLRCAQDR